MTELQAESALSVKACPDGDGTLFLDPLVHPHGRI